MARNPSSDAVIEAPLPAAVNDDELFDGEVVVWRRALAAENKVPRTLGRYADDVLKRRLHERQLKRRYPSVVGAWRLVVADDAQCGQSTGVSSSMLRRGSAK